MPQKITYATINRMDAHHCLELAQVHASLAEDETGKRRSDPRLVAAWTSMATMYASLATAKAACLKVPPSRESVTFRPHD
jgi:hypothetical protein